MNINIAIGSDHRGVGLKEHLKSFLGNKGYNVEDFGAFSEENTDYPDIAIPLSEGVSKGKFQIGILICMLGTGMCIAANKVKGIRAVLVSTPEWARLSRRHNNANILCLSVKFTDARTAERIVEEFIETDFEGERHIKRLEKIENYEEKTP